MPNFEQMMQSFKSYDGGQPRLNAIRNAIQEADLCNQLEWQFNFRYSYLKESVFCGDRYYAMIIFPELLALYENNALLHDDEQTTYYLLIAFKWIVEAAPEFPQISKQEIDNYFRLFRKMLTENGYSLSIYYMKHQLFYMHCDMGIAAADFYRFLEEPLDMLSDGKALYNDQQCMYYLKTDQEEKALKAAKPIFDGKLRADSLPQVTYHDFICYYMEHGRYEKAMEYAALIEKRIDRDAYYLDVIGSLLTLYSITALEKATQLFERNYPIYLESKNPLLRMQFEMGAYSVFSAVKNQPSELLPEIRVPFSSPVAEMLRQNQFSTIAAHFETLAADAAARFDARNGTEDFTKLLFYPYPEYA